MAGKYGRARAVTVTHNGKYHSVHLRYDGEVIFCFSSPRREEAEFAAVLVKVEWLYQRLVSEIGRASAIRLLRFLDIGQTFAAEQTCAR